MSKCLILMVCVSLLVSGCRTPPLPAIDAYVANVASHPIDVAPTPAAKPGEARTPTSGTAPAATPNAGDARPPAGGAAPPPNPGAAGPAIDAAPPPLASTAIQGLPAGIAPQPDIIVQTSSTQVDRQRPAPKGDRTDNKVIRASMTQVERTDPGLVAPPPGKFELTIPKVVPGSEAPLVTLPPRESPERPAAIARLFPQLPPLPEEPVAQHGPDGRAYTLADFQRIAAENNPGLRQAASDVEAARGLMIQAGLYPNPNIGYGNNPDNNNTGSGVQGAFVEQMIVTGGKLTLAVAGARMAMIVAELALKQTRYALATTIRGDFYTLLVAKETVRVNRGLAHFTDEIFRLQAELLGAGLAASHEPTALRSQAFIVRLAYKQSIQNYVYAWKQLVADMGLRQLPLSAVEGQVDRLIPYYDYDEVLAYVLRNHTNILTARANIDQARYGLKLARVTPVPNVDVTAWLFKEHMIQPFQNYFTIQLGIPFPIWDRNQGNIINADAALVRAAEGPHAAEVTLTTNLATAYATYKNNLFAMDYYRRNILPDQVRYYRGVFDRRRIDPTVAFGDLVQAQQMLVADVTAYLGILGSLWTSVVGVADFLQTDDLYQLGKPLALPELPDLESLHAWPCPHPNPGPGQAEVHVAPTPVPHVGAPTARAPNLLPTPAQGNDKPTAKAVSTANLPVSNPGHLARAPDQKLPVPKPTVFTPNSAQDWREQFNKLLRHDEPSSGAPTSVAAPPDAEGSGPIIPTPLQRSSATSLVGGAL
jgi:cobalt-zinc-cadmium efflux system outer membrane protein